MFMRSCHEPWLKINSVCCPLVVTPLLRAFIVADSDFVFTPCFSELLQSLDMCDNDPVAIAQCFVNKVSGKYSCWLTVISHHLNKPLFISRFFFFLEWILSNIHSVLHQLSQVCTFFIQIYFIDFEITAHMYLLFSSSVAALTDCMRNKTLAKFFRDRQASLKRSLPLGSYLLKPVQRILKYHLLLQVLNVQ